MWSHRWVIEGFSALKTAVAAASKTSIKTRVYSVGLSKLTQSVTILT
jgi:negative regulator of sigma E activity